MTSARSPRAVVLGASGAIGAAVVAELLERGLAVAAVARDRGRLDQLGAPSPTFAVVPGDLEDDVSATRVFDEAARELGGVDVVVSCLGAAPLGDFAALTDADWQAAWSTKVMANVHAFRGALPHLREAGGGRVVVVVGNDAPRAVPPMIASAAVDAALRNLVDGLNQQYGGEGISVVGVSPGPLVSPRIDAAASLLSGGEPDATAALRATILTGSPSGEVMMAADVASLVTYLVTPAARFVAGTTVQVDGGTAQP